MYQVYFEVVKGRGDMTNFEKYKDKIIYFLKEYSDELAVVNDKPVKCEGVKCSCCDLSSHKNCNIAFFLWGLREDESMPSPDRLTRRQEGYVVIDKNDDCPTMSYCEYCNMPVNRCKYFKDAIEKLDEYEDLDEKGLIRRSESE